MRFARKVGRFRAVIAAVVLAIGMFAAVPASTQPAQSATVQAACLPLWNQTFSSRGVTVCETTLLDEKIYVQIVDLNAGAKIRLISESCIGPPACHFDDHIRGTDLHYYKRTADDWFDWLQDPANFRIPDPDKLFSTSNASFFVDPSPLSGTSKLSLPESSLIEKFVGGNAQKESTFGWAFDTCPEDPNQLCHDDLAWDHSKIGISFGDADAAKQEVEVDHFFATHYTANDFYRLTTGAPPGECCVDLDNLYGDQTVGYTPQDTVGESPRTYVGVDSTIANTVYILNSAVGITGIEAQTFLEGFGAEYAIQLDGGGSTQLAADPDRDGDAQYLIESDDPIIDRGVPDTLAVYLSP